MCNPFTLTGLRLALVTAALALTTACGTLSNVDSSGHTQDPVFPDRSAASHDGSYVNLENLSKIREGMNKQQVMELIGVPQFSEGMFGVREWDYLFKFRQAEGEPDKLCQFKVLYDQDMIARSFHSMPVDCHQSEAIAVAEPEKAVTQQVNLAADATFAFGSAKLRPEGRAELDKVVAESAETPISAIDIVGHTDRIGSDRSNLELSHARAVAVRDYLVMQGMPAARFAVDGRGSAEPLVDCPGAKSAAVIECLAPNRRTTISIHTQAR